MRLQLLLFLADSRGLRRHAMSPSRAEESRTLLAEREQSSSRSELSSIYRRCLALP